MSFLPRFMAIRRFSQTATHLKVQSTHQTNDVGQMLHQIEELSHEISKLAHTLHKKADLASQQQSTGSRVEDGHPAHSHSTVKKNIGLEGGHDDHKVASRSGLDSQGFSDDLFVGNEYKAMALAIQTLTDVDFGHIRNSYLAPSTGETVPNVETDLDAVASSFVNPSRELNPNKDLGGGHLRHKLSEEDEEIQLEKKGFYGQFE